MPIHKASPTVTMSTDASNMGWGAVVETMQVRGPWNHAVSNKHINWKEMMAVWMGLKSLLRSYPPQTVRLEIDNATTVAYLNNQGGTHSRSLCEQLQ